MNTEQLTRLCVCSFIIRSPIPNMLIKNNELIKSVAVHRLFRVILFTFHIKKQTANCAIRENKL